MEIKSMNTIQHEIGEWADATFTHIARSIAAHLLDEAASLYFACGGTRPEACKIITEAPFKMEADIEDQTADVLILALTLADYRDVLAEELVETKMAVNRNRTWGAPNDRGFMEYVRTTEGGSND